MPETQRKSLYFASVRRMLIAFATVFDNMYIIRKDKDGHAHQTLKIPFEYGSKQHWFRKMQQLSQQSSRGEKGSPKVNLILPRISFVLRQAGYDAQRKRNTLNRVGQIVKDDLKFKQLSPVPYNLDVQMTVYAKNMDDLLMIFEQIVPLFSPQINLKIREVDDMNIWNDVDIMLQGPPQFNDNFEEGLDANRILSADFNCVIRGNIYPPTRKSAIIHKAIIDKFDITAGKNYLESTIVTADQTDPPDWDKENSTHEIVQRDIEKDEVPPEQPTDPGSGFDPGDDWTGNEW